MAIDFRPHQQSTDKSGKGELVIIQILHHSQEQAFRPVPQKFNFLVGWASRPSVKGLLTLLLLLIVYYYAGQSVFKTAENFPRNSS
jgi:hypothetical protein